MAIRSEVATGTDPSFSRLALSESGGAERSMEIDATLAKLGIQWVPQGSGAAPAVAEPAVALISDAGLQPLADALKVSVAAASALGFYPCRLHRQAVVRQCS